MEEMTEKQLLNAILKNQEYTQATLESFRIQTNKQFDEVNKRFEKVDQRFDEVDKRFEKVDQRFDEVDKRFEKVDQRFDEMDQRLDRIERETTRLARRTLWLEEDMQSAREKINF